MPDKILTDRARALRAGHTRAEALLWHALRNRKLAGWKWRRQVPRGPYIVDFLCAEAGLVVELDGWTHGEDAAAYDDRRTAFLEARGLQVIRFNNQGVFEGLAGVCDAILEQCGGNAPHPASPRTRGEEKA